MGQSCTHSCDARTRRPPRRFGRNPVSGFVLNDATPSEVAEVVEADLIATDVLEAEGRAFRAVRAGVAPDADATAMRCATEVAWDVRFHESIGLRVRAHVRSAMPWKIISRSTTRQGYVPGKLVQLPEGRVAPDQQTSVSSAFVTH